MKISVKVPATTANIGPGFDCLGMALPIYNTVTIEETVLPEQVLKSMFLPIVHQLTNLNLNIYRQMKTALYIKRLRLFTIQSGRCQGN